MAGGGIAKLTEELGDVLFDEDAPAAPELVAVSVTATFNDVKNKLEKYFRTPGAADAVTLGPPGMTAGDPGAALDGIGSGERLTLPGVSTRYKLLQFRCRRCSAGAAWLHYDTRGMPACEQGHREWEPQHEH
jgi:hypothetical protein